MSINESSKRRTAASYALWLQLQQGENAPDPAAAQEMIDRYGNAYLDVLCDLLHDHFVTDRRPGVYPHILEALKYINSEWENQH